MEVRKIMTRLVYISEVFISEACSFLAGSSVVYEATEATVFLRICFWVVTGS